ncbi:ParA family protein [Ideonella sp.]|uniref:ParA family protein n=1 Tax=Ideonella sp. TaxID=1929293 RepID=UPI002CAFF578|nr:AAA family ATPase [Ramlibacter sp.]
MSDGSNAGLAPEMPTPVLTFFNNKGGVGKTSLVFHLAWMLSEMGKRVVTIDLDHQANLTSAFLPEETLEELWGAQEPFPQADTIFRCVQPLTKAGDILPPVTRQITPRLFLVPGDPSLAGFEDDLASAWHAAMSSNLYRPFRFLTAFWQIAQLAAQAHQADLILADVGPNLGAINRSALIGSDHVVIPLDASLFSLQGLRKLGPTLTTWREEWRKRADNWEAPEFPLPSGSMSPTGYVVMRHTTLLSRPVSPYKKWADQIPAIYRESVLGQPGMAPTLDQDTHCLAQLKHYRSLIPMSQEVRKPIFHLNSADGAIGSHSQAVQDAWQDFKALATTIADRIHLDTVGDS